VDLRIEPQPFASIDDGELSSHRVLEDARPRTAPCRDVEPELLHIGYADRPREGTRPHHLEITDSLAVLVTQTSDAGDLDRKAVFLSLLEDSPEGLDEATLFSVVRSMEFREGWLLPRRADIDEG
jgi:hypothetical protein